MAKKAVLVDWNITTRAVVDLPEGMDPGSDKAFELISEELVHDLRNKIKSDVNFPYPENIGEIEEDEEIPYGEAPEDNE